MSPDGPANGLDWVRASTETVAAEWPPNGERSVAASTSTSRARERDGLVHIPRIARGTSSRLEPARLRRRERSGVELVGREGDRVVYRVGSGNYKFRVRRSAIEAVDCPRAAESLSPGLLRAVELNGDAFARVADARRAAASAWSPLTGHLNAISATSLSALLYLGGVASVAWSSSPTSSCCASSGLCRSALVFVLFPVVAQVAAVLGGERGMGGTSLACARRLARCAHRPREPRPPRRRSSRSRPWRRHEPRSRSGHPRLPEGGPGRRLGDRLRLLRRGHRLPHPRPVALRGRAPRARGGDRVHRDRPGARPRRRGDGGTGRRAREPRPRRAARPRDLPAGGSRRPDPRANIYRVQDGRIAEVWIFEVNSVSPARTRAAAASKRSRPSSGSDAHYRACPARRHPRSKHCEFHARQPLEAFRHCGTVAAGKHGRPPHAVLSGVDRVGCEQHPVLARFQRYAVEPGVCPGIGHASKSSSASNGSSNVAATANRLRTSSASAACTCTAAPVARPPSAASCQWPRNCLSGGRIGSDPTPAAYTSRSPFARCSLNARISTPR